MSPATDVKYLAIHLPQFHPVPQNDRWWGRGFTEWTNVVRARPRFPGHQQPHLPADLGFYDLRLPEARAAQAELARAHGIDGFCYYHYWFQGQRLLERPVDEILASGKPDFPFCLCWANESWSRRWDGGEHHVLMAQNYDEADDVAHFKWLLRAFQDQRYIRVGGKPLFLFYRAHDITTLPHLVPTWQRLAAEAGLPGLYLVSVRNSWNAAFDPRAHGLQASMRFQPFWQHVDDVHARGLGVRIEREVRAALSAGTYGNLPTRVLARAGTRALDRVRPQPRDRVVDYAAFVAEAQRAAPPPWREFPGITPMWDNAARRQTGATILHGSTPALFEDWLTQVTAQARALPAGERLVFINAWNEWAEGNHLEPDEAHGRAYLEAVARAKAAAG